MEHAAAQRRRSSASRLSGKAALLLDQGADRRGAIADQAEKMAHQLQEVLAKNHVQHQHLRGAECQLRQELDGAKLALTSSQEELEKERQHHADTHARLMQENADTQAELEQERQRSSGLRSEASALSAHIETLKEQIDQLSTRIHDVEEEKREQATLFEEDLSKEKELAAECRERLYQAERDVQTTRNLALKRETQIEQLHHSISETKWEGVDATRQIEIQIREMDLAVRSLEKALPEAIRRQRHEHASCAQLLAVSKAREDALESLVRDKERFALQLQGTVDLLKESGASSVRDYERRLATMNSVIAEIKAVHERDLSAISDLKASNEYMDDSRREKDALIHRLQDDLKAALLASKDAELLVQEADFKMMQMEQEMEEQKRKTLQEKSTWEEQEQERERERREGEERRDAERQKAQAITDTLIEQLENEVATTKKQLEELTRDSSERQLDLEKKLQDREQELMNQHKEHQLVLEKQLQDREQELMDQQTVITGLEARILQAEELLRAEEERGVVAAAAAEQLRMAETQKMEAALALSNQSVAVLEAKLEVVAEQLQEASMRASQVPHLLQCRDRVHELETTLQEKRRRTKERERELESTLQAERERLNERLHEEERAVSKVLAENHSLKALVVMLEEQAERLNLSIHKEDGKNKTLVHELEKERQVLASQREEVQKVLHVNSELRAELSQALTISEAVDSYTSKLEKEFQALDTVLREAVARAFEFGDVRNSETELRLRAHKLAGLISEMEVTMLQTEDMLAEESRTRQAAEKALSELESMYAHLESEHDAKQQQVADLESRLDKLVEAMTAQSEKSRGDQEESASERRALREHIDRDQKLQAAQQKEIEKWRRRADDMQIRGNKVAVALKIVEDQVLQLFRVVEHGLAQGQGLKALAAGLGERGQWLQLECKQGNRNVAALEKRIGEMASQLAASTVRNDQTQSVLKEMEIGWGSMVDAIENQLNRLRIEMQDVKKSEVRFQAQEARMRALVQEAKEEASAQRSRAEAAWAEAEIAQNAADKVAIELSASLNASKAEAEDLREELREHRQRALQLQESVRHHKEKVEKERDRVEKSEAEVRKLQMQGVTMGEQMLQMQNELADMKRMHDNVVSVAAQQTETIRGLESQVAEVSAARDASIAQAEGMHLSGHELEAEVERLKELVRGADEDKQAQDLCAEKAANEIERLRKVCANLEQRVLELTAQCTESEQLHSEARADLLKMRKQHSSERESLWSEITRLTGHVQVLQEDRGAHSDDEVHKLRSSLTETINRNRSLLDDLDLSLQARDETEATNLELRRANVVLKNKVTACVEELESAIQFRGGGQQLNANASLLKVLKKINSISKGVLLHEDQP